MKYATSTPYGMARTLTPSRRPKYITGATNEDKVLEAVRRLGKRGVSSRKIYGCKQLTLTWEEVDIALGKLLKQGRVIVSNGNYWPNHRIR